jgi:hypothetical protein
MRDAVLKKRLMVLAVIVIAIVVWILLAFNIGDKPGKSGDDNAGAVNAGIGEVESDGFVVEDTATVQVDINDDAASEPAAEG